jgi:hypothetical protein
MKLRSRLRITLRIALMESFHSDIGLHPQFWGTFMIKFNLMNSVRIFCRTGILKVPCIVALSTERAKKEQYVPFTCVNFSSGKCLSHERFSVHWRLCCMIRLCHIRLVISLKPVDMTSLLRYIIPTGCKLRV